MFKPKKVNEENSKPIVFRKGVRPSNEQDSENDNIFSDVDSDSDKETDKLESSMKFQQKDNLKTEHVSNHNSIPIQDLDDSIDKDNNDNLTTEKIEKSIDHNKDKDNVLDSKVEAYVDPILKVYDDTKKDSVDESYKVAKPVFIPKDIREEKNNIEENKDRMKKLKKENKYLSANAIRIIDEEQVDLPLNLPDDDDTTNTAIEYSKWKLRELERIHRDQNERLRLQKLKEETERRRALTEEERHIEDKRLKKGEKNLKSDYRYMQKYYSSLTFFQDKDEDIYKRDFNVAVGYDTFDKSALPSRMQVRGDEISKKGKSKYKDLFTEDTGNYDPNYAPDSTIVNKIQKRQGGYKS